MNRRSVSTPAHRAVSPPTCIRKAWVFENEVLKKMLGPEREKVTGEWRKLHSEELCGLYCSPSDEVKEKRDGRDMWHVCSAGLSKRGARLRCLWRAPKSYCAEQKRTNVLVY
jgi:hypothetical protein